MNQDEVRLIVALSGAPGSRVKILGRFRGVPESFGAYTQTWGFAGAYTPAHARTYAPKAQTRSWGRTGRFGLESVSSVIANGRFRRTLRVHASARPTSLFRTASGSLGINRDQSG